MHDCLVRETAEGKRRIEEDAPEGAHLPGQLSEGGYTLEETKQLFPGQSEEQLEEEHRGLNAELEHAQLTQGSDVLTRAMVEDHLREDPEYYAKLLSVMPAKG